MSDEESFLNKEVGEKVERTVGAGEGFCNDSNHGGDSCTACDEKGSNTDNKGDTSPVSTPTVDAAATAGQQPSGSTGRRLDLNSAMELFNLRGGSATDPQMVKTKEDAKKKTFKFWETQPVRWFDDEIEANEPIETDKELSQLRQEPYSLPTGFQWDLIDVHSESQLKELYILLNENYVEDDDNMFRFDYSPEFLKWALTPPGWSTELHVGVRVQKSKKLVGFIAAIPCTIRIYDKTKNMVEINFLCVHKKLRSKRVAPVLIKEITRRVNLRGMFQAVYTAGRVLPTPVGTCRYWHRSLNPKKLVEVQFSHLAKNMTIQRMVKLYKLPDKPQIPTFRAMTPEDMRSAHDLLASYLAKFSISPVFTIDEFEHWFLPRKNVVDSFVVTDKAGKVTDLVNYYTLPSTIMNHPAHKTLRAAYAFYNVADSVSWIDLMQDALIVAKSKDYDVFNALDLMDNASFLEPLKFGIGDGNLHYYIYNWKCPEMKPSDIGLVLQ